MYVRRLATWGFAKNYTEARVTKLLHQKGGRDAVDKVSKFGGEGEKVDIQRIEKYLTRKKKTAGISVAVEKEVAVRSSDEASMLSPPRDRHSSARLPTHGDYEHNCPYSQRTKKFRLMEEFPRYILC